MPKYLLSIIGPTAIGKTRVSIEIAKALNTEIISCDSRQFYKEMQIGTAVPSLEELAEVQHHFIQDISIFEDYSVGDYEKKALQKIDELFKKYDILCLTGGSGLYQKAVIEGLDDFPKVDSSIRKNLNQIYKNEGLEPLQNQLKQLDPNHYKVVDLQNPHRLIRALEICIGTSKPYSSFLKSDKADNRNFQSVKIGLQAEREIIYKRIEQRVEQMFDTGLIEEAKKLHPYKHLNALQTVGYKELFAYFEDVITLEEAKSEIKKNTRRYAKRQLTWYRKQEDIQWFSYNVKVDEILRYIKSV